MAGTITGSEGGDVALKVGEQVAGQAATAGIEIGIGAAIGNAIPIPGIGALIGLVVGAIIAGFNALPNALKSKFHPYPEDASAAVLVFAHLNPHAFFSAGIDAANNSHDFVKLIRYFRIRAGVVPKGYLGNTFDLEHFRKTGDAKGQLYDPVSSWARPWAGTDCTNRYLCAVDPLDPMTDESHIQHLMDGGANAHEVSHPIEAQGLLKIMRDHLKPIEDVFHKTGKAEQERVRKEIILIRRLAGEVGEDPKLSEVFGDVNVTIDMLTPAQRVEAKLVGKKFTNENGVPGSIDRRGMFTPDSVESLSPDQRIKAGLVGKQVTISGLSGHIDPQGAFIADVKTSGGPGEQSKTTGLFILGGVAVLTLGAFAALIYQERPE